MAQEYHLTAAGLAELQTELAELKARRPEVANKLKTAKAEGDLSENADYSSALEEQQFNEGRVADIEKIIHNAVVIATGGANGHVALGNTVELESAAKTLIYTVVGSLESDPGEGKISEDSPIGKALLGTKVGDTVEIATPNGARQCTVKKIS